MKYRYQNRLKLGSGNGNAGGKQRDADRDQDGGVNKCVYDSERDSRRRRRVLRPQTDNQRLYIGAIEDSDIVFCLGPAGSGKSCVAAGMAARSLLGDEVRKIVGVRPALEVGRPIGFLPGTLEEKVHPYLKPLMEELADFLGREELRKMRLGETPIVDLAALGYLRGTNFKESFVILDEAQNATFAELWMLLTRLSCGSKIVINGDPSQSDLPVAERGALEHYARIFADLDGVGVVTMTKDDIVRHPLVRRMMEVKERERGRERSAG